MNDTPPAVIAPAPVEAEEAAFRADVRSFMAYVRDELKFNRDTLETLLREKALDDG